MPDDGLLVDWPTLVHLLMSRAEDGCRCLGRDTEPMTDYISPSEPTEEQTDDRVLALLLDRFPGPLPVPVPEPELERAHGDRIAVQDALERLIRHGLASRHGNLVLASQAAARFEAISGGR
jgi:hypothetical protein